jgi:hypothetical protein
MAMVIPLIDIPMNAFNKTGRGYNEGVLYDLRKRAKRSDGYFMYHEEIYIKDTFVLTGTKHNGTWKLGKITATPSQETDYHLEVYRKAYVGTGLEGSVYMAEALDDDALVNILRSLDKGVGVLSYPSPWEMGKSETFASLGFDIL